MKNDNPFHRFQLTVFTIIAVKSKVTLASVSFTSFDDEALSAILAGIFVAQIFTEKIG